MRAAWRGVTLLAAAHFLAHADRALPSAVAPILRARFALSDPASASVVAGAVVLAAAPIGAGAGGWLMDAVRRGGGAAPSLVSALLLAVPGR